MQEDLRRSFETFRLRKTECFSAKQLFHKGGHHLFLIFLSDSSLGTMLCRDPSPSSDDVRFALVDFPRGPLCKGLPRLVFLYGLRLVVITHFFAPLNQ